MHIDGREITVAGSLLQPLNRRIRDILRVVLAAVLSVADVARKLALHEGRNDAEQIRTITRSADRSRNG